MSWEPMETEKTTSCKVWIICRYENVPLAMRTAPT